MSNNNYPGCGAGQLQNIDTDFGGTFLLAYFSQSLKSTCFFLFFFNFTVLFIGIIIIFPCCKTSNNDNIMPTVSAVSM
jgi:hypothetical protein